MGGGRDHMSKVRVTSSFCMDGLFGSELAALTRDAATVGGPELRTGE
jgi:hypothetical protein